MNCEKAIETLASPDRFHRILAARAHVLNCESCRRAVEQNETLSKILAVVPTLPESDRAAWLRVTDEQAVSLPRRGRRVLAVAMTVAALALGAFLLFRSVNRPGPIEEEPHVNRPRPDSPVTEKHKSMAGASVAKASVRPLLSDDTQPLDDLQSSLAQLSGRVDRLLEAAELLDERRQAEQLLRRYAEMNDGKKGS